MKLRMIPSLVLAAAALGACERLVMAPPKADSAPLSAPQGPDVRPFVGQTYPAFASQEGMARFELAALGLTEADTSRFEAAHAQASPGVWIAGGGVQALVFYGCGAEGCDAAASVLAVDGVTGESFVGIRDAAGAEVLVPNLRLEALLRLGSASGQWDDPTPRERPAAP